MDGLTDQARQRGEGHKQVSTQLSTTLFRGAQSVVSLQPLGEQKNRLHYVKGYVG